MFDRKVCKQIARKQLDGRWTTPVLVTLVCSLIYAAFNIPDVPLLKPEFETYHRQMMNGFQWGAQMLPLEHSWYTEALPWITIIIFSITEMAQTYLYVVLSRTTVRQPFDTFIQGFNLWAKGLLSTLWMSLWIFLWSLLFVIPGIVKAFAYSQTQFILAENPHMSVVKAVKLSRIMTRGYKGELFAMGLSFIGWAILATIPAGLGWLWLTPYMHMSFTNAYHLLKKRAIEVGDLTPQDFC